MILRFYKLYNIQPFHFPVIDMDVIDMCYKLQDVSRLLHFLVTTLNVRGELNFSTKRVFFLKHVALFVLESVCALHSWNV